MDSDGTRKTNDGSATKGTPSQKGLDLDVSLSGQTCDVCYDLLQYPVNLPCSHIFCFLCIKGAYFNNKLCPMCRAPIPDHIIKRPQVTKTSDSKNSSRSSRSDSLRSNSKKTEKADESSIFWCYESRRENKTWWKYDARTCTELETFYQQYLTDIDKTFHDLQIAGEMYKKFQKRAQFTCLRSLSCTSFIILKIFYTRDFKLFFMKSTYLQNGSTVKIKLEKDA